MIKSLDDVIAAVATPIGEGGISVIRVSGKQAIEITDRGFRGKKSLTKVSTHTAHYGNYLDINGNLIDEVVITVFHEPHSYTAENSVEVSCHGGIYVTREILDSVIAYGARLAEPGEFTKRAFLNGRIDLSQAEAVAEIISAKSELYHKSSLFQLQGSLSRKIFSIRQELLDICSHIELQLDFSEEGLDFSTTGTIIIKIGQIRDTLDNLIDSFKIGKLYRDGMKVVITGEPNVGKSSLMNSLLKRDRSIVTNVPGTTRDTIEESIDLDGLLIRLVDTAGLRKSANLIENEGIKRSKEQIVSADLILFLIDSSYDNNKASLEVYAHFIQNNSSCRDKKCIIVFNKIDLIGDDKQIIIPTAFTNMKNIFVSTKTGNGIEPLKRAITEFVSNAIELSSEEGVVVTNSRHLNQLKRANFHLISAHKALETNSWFELVAIDLREALNLLGEITGEISSDELLDNIFSKFCIGK
jgi:tRNA modification GTPase